MAILVYKLFLWLYKCGAVLLSPFNKKAKYWLSGREDIFRKIQSFFASHNRPVIWFHCASLGEFEQVRPLMEKIHQQYPNYCLYLSFFSPSGYEIRKDYEGADFISYLPMDGAVAAEKLLDIVKPSLVIWVKYEYWYYFLKAINKRKIPLLLVSGIFRPDQPFFKPWGRFHREMLSCFSAFFVQDTGSKELLTRAGFGQNSVVSGDTRFDRVIEIAENPVAFPVIESFIGGSRAVVAGSTWEEDEEELDHFANTHPELKFIIAPHEIEESRLLEVEKLFHHSVRYSAFKEPGFIVPPNTNVLIIDNIGMLSRLYKFAYICYVGGGFGEDGVHNVLEAAVYGKPVIIGPVYDKFLEAVALVENGAAFYIENALELEDTLKILLDNEDQYRIAADAAKDYVYSQRGATRAIIDYIQEKRLLTS